MRTAAVLLFAFTVAVWARFLWIVADTSWRRVRDELDGHQFPATRK